jgi:FAD/FMN-containing dehydrogenase
VNYASANNISFLAQGGGHGYSVTFGALQNGLAIDLSSFNNVSVNAAENTMTIGGGVRFRDVFEPLYAAGKEIRMSSYPRLT